MQTPLAPGEKLNNGRYRIESSLASGGFGITYLGIDTSLNRSVAIKEYFPVGCDREGVSIVPAGTLTKQQYSHHLKHFIAEGEKLARFDHPGIVTIHDCFEEHATAYLVMEFIKGQTLKQYLAANGGKLSVDDAITLIRQIGEALIVVHKENILHRDIKPDNIMLRADGKPVIIDFGSAREYEIVNLNNNTVVFTPGYASPEQCSPDGERGAFNDVYGLAATGYALLTGKPPLDAIARFSGTKLEPISNFTVDVPKRLEKAILKGLEIDISSRPQNVEEFLQLCNGMSAWSSLKFRLKSPFVREQTPISVPSSPTVSVSIPRQDKQNSLVNHVIKSLPTKKNNNIDGAEMILILAGEFLMGSSNDDKNAKDNEKPQHKVYLDNYYMYKNEVTVAQYRKFCDMTKRKMPADKPSWGWLDNHPMVNVTWHDAKAYADWAEVSLPTEAQWEKAARGTDGRIYPWGNEWDASKIVNYSNLSSCTQPIGSILAGASFYGILDMVGNVWEWCADWYSSDNYENASLNNPMGLEIGECRVVRGGSWGVNDGVYRCAFRGYFGRPDHYGYFTGFRCASP